MDGEFRVLVSHHGGGFPRSFEESKRKRNLRVLLVKISLDGTLR